MNIAVILMEMYEKDGRRMVFSLLSFLPSTILLMNIRLNDSRAHIIDEEIICNACDISHFHIRRNMLES
jgi:hypothetical protein